eukprot:802298-Pyramimonas_sp.AAC.1
MIPEGNLEDVSPLWALTMWVPANWGYHCGARHSFCRPWEGCQTSPRERKEATKNIPRGPHNGRRARASGLQAMT